MTLSWQDCSEIVVGLLIKRRIPEKSVQPDKLFPPYDKVAREYLSGTTDPADLVKNIGLNTFQACLYAVENVNGQAALSWLEILEKTKCAYEAGIAMEKAAVRLQRGEEIDWSKINYYAKLAQHNESSQFTPLSAVEAAETPYIKTGYAPIDKELWGIPKVGLIVVGGATGAGKTWFFTKVSSKFAETHPDKQVAFFSLEMMLEEIKSRYLPYNLPNCVQERIQLYQHPTTVENIIGQCAAIENLGLIGIDFADLLVKGEVNAASMEVIYKTLMMGAKELGVPIMLLAQLTGYNGGVPTPDMMRWTKLAGMLGWSVWTLYNPMKDWFTGSGKEEIEKRRGLPVQPKTAFLCAWKMRGGFWKEGPEKTIDLGNGIGKVVREKILRDDDPIAIQIPFLPERGWGDKHRTYRLKDSE